MLHKSVAYNGADTHARNQGNETPLIVVAKDTKNPEIIRTLLSSVVICCNLLHSGADTTMQEATQHTAYAFATGKEGCNNSDILELLKPSRFHTYE